MSHSRKNIKTGKFERLHKPWSLENFDDGYIDDRGRMRVCIPGHARGYGRDYVLRAIVAYEAYHNTIVPKGYVVHHKNENKLDDSKENLEAMTIAAHTRHHCSKKPLVKTCFKCKSDFEIPQWRVNMGRGKYCSSQCYESRLK